MIFIEGLLIGIGMIIFIGPVFFTLLNTSLNYGFWAGFFVALGIFLSDIICVLLCFMGAMPIFKNPDNQWCLAIVGSTILFFLGIKYLFWPSINSDNVKTLKPGHYSFFLTQGFLVNFVNPFVFIIWIGITGLAQTRYGESSSLYIYLAAILIGIFSTDVLKVFLSQKIKQLMRPNFLVNTYKLIGVILIFFALRMGYYAFNYL